MKTNKANYPIIKTTIAIACLLAITACANTAQKTVPASDHKSQLNDGTRADNNSLLPASFYASNHLIDS